MRKHKLIVLSLTCALALCGCASSGNARLPPPELTCPKPQVPPASLMVVPTYEQQVRGILFESPPDAMRR